VISNCEKKRSTQKHCTIQRLIQFNIETLDGVEKVARESCDEESDTEITNPMEE